MGKTTSSSSQTGKKRLSIIGSGSISSGRNSNGTKAKSATNGDGCPTENGSTVPIGESTFKAYNFDQIENDPDMEKCIQFWKKIMDNNFKARSCKCDKVPAENRCNVSRDVQKTKKKLPKQDELDLNFWVEAVKQLQKRRLNEFKVQAFKACNYCLKFDPDKSEQREEIKKLNDWKPTSSYSDTKSGGKEIRRKELGRKELEVVEEVVKLNDWKPVTKDKFKKNGGQREPPKLMSLSDGNTIVHKPVEDDDQASEANESLGKLEFEQNIFPSKDLSESLIEDRMDRDQLLMQYVNNNSESRYKILKIVDITSVTNTTEMNSGYDRKCMCGCGVDCCICAQPIEVTCICPEGTVRKPKKLVSTNNIKEREEICCDCGCDVTSCICEKMHELTETNYKSEEKREISTLTRTSAKSKEIFLNSSQQIGPEDMEFKEQKCSCGCDIAFCLCEAIIGLETQQSSDCGCLTKGKAKSDKLDDDNKCKCGCGVDCCPCSNQNKRPCRCFFKETSESCASLKSFDDHTVGLQCSFTTSKDCLVCKS